jgi:hypothetical protein
MITTSLPAPAPHGGSTNKKTDDRVIARFRPFTLSAF